MANVLSLALKINADASGLKLDPVSRALQKLGEETDRVSGIFDKFTSTSEAAARAQTATEQALNDLIAARKAGTVTATEFAESFRTVEEAAKRQAAEFQRGADITERYTTEEEKRARTLAELEQLLQAGAIKEDVYAKAVADASGATAAAAEAEKQRVAALAEAEKQRQAVLDEGLRLAQRYATEDEKRTAGLQRVQELLDQGAITEEVAARARADASGANEAAAKAEKQRADALAAAARIIEANLTPQERYDAQIQELRGHLDDGRLSQEQYNRAAAKAQQDLDRVGQQASKTDKNIESLTKNVRILSAIEIGRLLVDGFQALGGIFSSVTNQITSLVSNVNSSLDTLVDFSARTGIGVEALQGYSLAAKLAGVDTEAFGTAVQKLAVSIGKATPGGELDKSLRQINLSVAELRALSPEQQFSVIGEAISQLPTAADRAAASVAIFGKQGAALAPLFREGADSIDELRERAERLGIIVSETQIENVAAMNDAFDLVSATIQGIVGQVIGNLAPAVTAVVDEFLTFIESWSGAEGTGGTGIANAITEVLLTGAETLAGVFDKFVGDFSGFTGTLQGVGQTFSFIANILTAASETLRVIFNVFEGIGNGIALALGKVLEGIGSWVSSDMEAFGKSLQESARAAMDQNNKDLESAATNAANAMKRAFTGDAASPAAAGEGAATQFVQGVRQRFEREQAPEFRFNTNIEQTRERFDSFFNGIVDQSSAVVEPMREFEAAVAAAQEDGKLTADEIARIEQLQAKVNSSLDQELAKRQEAAEAAAKQAEEVDKIIAGSLEQMRIDNEFGGDSSRAKAADNLLKIQQEQIRVEEQLAAARAAGDQEAVDAATSRLATLDQVAAQERDIASGAAKQRKEAAKEAEKLAAKVAEQQQKLADRQHELELERANELANVRTGSVQINDLRSGGISQFFETLQEDPAIAEAKKQRAELEKIRKEIAKLNAERVDILAGTG
jgi:colicin import membrane protein